MRQTKVSADNYGMRGPRDTTTRRKCGGSSYARASVSPRRYDTRGFTLLEIVVALAIVSIGVTLALQLFSGALKNVRKMDLAAQAMNHAENIMNEILSDENIKGARAMHDDIDDNFRWEAVIQEFEIPEQSKWNSQQPFPMKLLNVRVDVIYRNDKNGKVYRLSCLKPVGLRQAQKPGGIGVPVNPFGNAP
ncbi:MAG: type II secretion system protein [Acidobacteria bacterium]|nr:type II secretion system protein [Acidobacteriota bacterium]